MDARFSQAAAQHHLQAVLEEFFRLKNEGLTAETLDQFFGECDRLGGSQFREQVEKHIGRYAEVRALGRAV